VEKEDINGDKIDEKIKEYFKDQRCFGGSRQMQPQKEEGDHKVAKF